VQVLKDFCTTVRDNCPAGRRGPPGDRAVIQSFYSIGFVAKSYFEVDLLICYS
jgi:hypothetical protein